MTFTLLDGGTGQELIRRAQRTPSPLWSADVLGERPDLVEAVHADFLGAGADVVTLASYSVTPARLARAGREAEFEPLQAAAVTAAEAARNRIRPEGRVAGCVPPLPGSYRPGERLARARAEAEYARIVEAQSGGADLYLCETLASVAEVRLAVRAAARSGREVWAAMTVAEDDGTKLRSGEPLRAGADAALEEGADAVLVNCSPPEAVSAAMEVLRPRTQRFGAYANGFVTTAPYQGEATVDALEVRRDVGPQAYAAFAADWRDAGASIIGGCCEIGPAHLRALDALRRAA